MLNFAKPPALFTWLLRRFDVKESIVGDLIERYRQHPSWFWLWRQTFTTIAVTVSHDIRTHKFLAVRAVLIGWALLSLFGSVPLGRWFLDRTVAWEVDAVPMWGLTLGRLVLWLPTLLFAMLTGYVVAFANRTLSMAMVFALVSTLALACVVPWAVGTLSGLSHSPQSNTGAVFTLYVQLWTSLSAAGVLVGGAVGARSADRLLRSFA
jgi:hypothetical protein